MKLPGVVGMIESKAYTFDLLDCSIDLHSQDLMNQVASDFCEAFGLTCIGDSQQAYPDHGLTLIVFLAQSHLVVSTWPELQVAQIDLSLCGSQPNFDRMKQWLLAAFGAAKVRAVEHTRALHPPE